MSGIALVPGQVLKLGLSVIPAQAGIQIAALDYRLRGNDEPENQELTRRKPPVTVSEMIAANTGG